MAKVQKKSAVWGELGAATLGVALGGVLGMLFAPKSGKQTRKAVAVQGKKVATTATKTVKKASKAVKSAVPKK